MTGKSRRFSEFKLRFAIFRRRVSDIHDELRPTVALPHEKSALRIQEEERYGRIQRIKNITMAFFATFIGQPAGWMILEKSGSNFVDIFAGALLIVWGSAGVLFLFFIQKGESEDSRQEISHLKSSIAELRFEIEKIKKQK